MWADSLIEPPFCISSLFLLKLSHFLFAPGPKKMLKYKGNSDWISFIF